MTPTDHATAPSSTSDTAEPGSLAWLWPLVAVSVVLLLVLNVFALIPVGVVLLLTGIVRRLTATDPRNRAAGTGLALAGFALAGVTGLLVLTLLGGPDAVLIEEGAAVTDVMQPLGDG